MAAQQRPQVSKTIRSATAPEAPSAPKQAHQRQQQCEGAIPRLSSISPAIFVPVTQDLTKPPPAVPTDPRQRLEQELARIDAHAAQVQRNIRYMLRREVERNHRAGLGVRPEWQGTDEAAQATIPPGLSPAQEKLLLEVTNGLESEWAGIADEQDPVLNIVRNRQRPPRDPRLEGSGRDRDRDRERERDRERIASRMPSPPAPGGPWEFRPGPVPKEMFPEDQAIALEPARTYASKYFLNLIHYGLVQLEGHANYVKNLKAEKIRQFEALHGSMNLHPTGYTGDRMDNDQ
ncbi:hypothetical protein F5Y15DRAFT_413819 [Xylariaceae sp. FL0016]|nr:hypothetical protein F5Y15DRAFT_413819 [Xylariaceae sp. FL0016]